MRYASIRTFDVTNGNGIGVALFTQGCLFHCKNCFNKDTWDLDGGKEWNSTIEDSFIELVERPYIKRVSILGGEPLLDRNIEELTKLFKKIKELFPEKKIWVYSGNTYEVIENKYKELLSYVDVLVDGLYVDELRDLRLPYRGSSNQRVIDVQKSLDSSEIVLFSK